MWSNRGIWATVSLLICAQLSTAQQEYEQYISAEALSKHLTILASDKFEGRETGERGQKLAADYIRIQFQKMGLTYPEKLGSHYQYFELDKFYPEGLDIRVGNKDLTTGEDYTFFFAGDPNMTKSFEEIVFCGYGINADKWNDYKKADVKGKLVVVLEGEPKKKGKYIISKTQQPSKWRSVRTKAKEAERQGASAMLVLTRMRDDRWKEMGHFAESGKLKLKKKQPEKIFPHFLFRYNKVEKVLGINEWDLSEDPTKPSKGKTYSLSAPVTLNLHRKTETITTENVLGVLPGSEKPDEYVFVTAHYDHLGKRDSVIYNGADDDGSGTSAILVLAEAFATAAANGERPKRTIVFMPVSGEEKGLLGSRYYTDNPVFPLENTIADLNIDMIGRTDTNHTNSNFVYVIGADKISQDLHDINEEANKKNVGLNLDYRYNDENDPNRFYYRSDHYNFAKNGVPVIFYFCGVHEDYHKPTDTIEKIQFDKAAKITKLVYYTLWELANREERIKRKGF